MPGVDIDLGGEHHLVNFTATLHLHKSSPETLIFHQLTIAETQHKQTVGGVLLCSGEHKLSTLLRENITHGSTHITVGIGRHDVAIGQEAFGEVNLAATHAVGTEQHQFRKLALQLVLLVHRPEDPVPCVIIGDALAASWLCHHFLTGPAVAVMVQQFTLKIVMDDELVIRTIALDAPRGFIHHHIAHPQLLQFGTVETLLVGLQELLGGHLLRAHSQQACQCQ